MGRPSKGVRLYLRAGRIDARSRRAVAPVYFIRDGAKNVSTGCGPERLAEAEVALAEYLTARQASQRKSGRAQDPDEVSIDDVIALYALEKAPKAADPASVASRLGMVLDWWSGKSVGDIRRSSCQAYVQYRCSQPIKTFKDPKRARLPAPATPRRELEDLSAAVSWWAGEHPLTRKPEFTYPPSPGESSRDALSRSEAAALLWAAMGWRKQPDGRWKRLSKSAIANRRHLRRFILLGLYSGSRPGVLPKLHWTPSDDSAWVDLDKGWVYRRGRREADHPTKRRPAFRLSKRLMAHLTRWRRMDEERSALLLDAGEAALTTVLHHGGVPIRGKIRKGYANVVADAGVNPDVTPHWHRHTCATWLMEADVPLRRAAQYLGMTARTLEKHYAHHRPGFQNDVADAAGKGGR